MGNSVFSFFKREMVVKTICVCQVKESKFIRFAQFSQILTTFITIVAVSVAYYQIKSAESQAQKQLAKSLYQSYLELAFEHPEFAEPDFLNLCKDIGSEEIYKLRKCQAQYEWFVSRMLYTAENILAFDLKDENMEIWKRTIESQVSKHSEYLKTKLFSTSIDTYSCHLLPILEKYGAEKLAVTNVYNEQCFR